LTTAEIEAKLKGLGSAKEILKGNPSSPLAVLLQELIQDVTDQLVAKVHQYDAVASGNLVQNIRPTSKATLEGEVLSVSITAPFYWKFVNYGVNGTEVNRGAPNWGQQQNDRSFHSSIMDWTRNRGISLPEQFDSYDQFAWAIMGSIKKKGIEKRPFFTDVVNESLYDALSEPISTLIGKAIKINIIEPWQ
jgi:hypothetical protein